MSSLFLPLWDAQWLGLSGKNLRLYSPMEAWFVTARISLAMLGMGIRS